MEVNMKDFFDVLSATEPVILSTSERDIVTARPVSPLCMEKDMIVRTSKSSEKGRQMLANPHVAVCLNGYYCIGVASLAGDVNSKECAPIKEAYMKRHSGSFADTDTTISPDEVFFRITFTKVSQWVFENGIPLGLAQWTLA